jgi:hypothetical protein
MKVAGFTFIKNAIKYDYPIIEAITSILPICDEFIVAIGDCDDETIALIQNIETNKIKIIQTTWDETLRAGGKVLAEETNKAFKVISNDTDWCFYIQGDEVVHEKYLPIIKQAMLDQLSNHKVDGLLFNYLHFYGSYQYIGASNSWYTHEIRIIRNDHSIYSYKDAQGFRKMQDQKLNVKAIDAFIYHYGWIKDPFAMQRKQEHFNKYWHDDAWVAANVVAANSYDYSLNIKELKLFEGTHPSVMKDRIQRMNWKFEFDISKNKIKLKDYAKRLLKRYFKIDFAYKNYKLHK